jgi:glycosyltransferase involved in cell wall biosynthesis
MSAPGRVEYVFHKGLTEPIPRIHGLPQVVALSGERPFSVISFEPATRVAGDEEVYATTRRWLGAAGVRHVPLPVTWSRWIDIALGALRIVWDVAATGVRIVHCRSYIAGFMGLLACAVTPARFLFDARGLFVDEYLYEGAFRVGTLRYRFARWLERRLYLGADAVVVVSERFRRHLLGRADLAGRLDPAVLTVIPCRVDLERFDTPADARSRVRDERGWGDAVVGIYVGSRSPWHRLDRACALMARVMEERPEVRLAIATYPTTEKAEQLAADAGIPPDRVTFVTARTEEVPALLAAADFGLMIEERHLIREVCSPVKFAEYAAAGLPIVATDDIGDVSDWIRDEELGIIVDPADVNAAARGVSGLLDSEDFRSGATAGRLRAFAGSRMGMARTLEEYAHIYRALDAS